MADPIDFPSTTTHFALPLLFAGQAQKEPTINHAFSVIDALLRGTLDASLVSPPSAPEEGSMYRVLDGAVGDWESRDGDLAVRIGGTWDFLSPSDGMTIFDSAAGVRLHYDGSWQTADQPAQPAGGTTIDTEARAAISELIHALQTTRAFGTSS